MIRVFGEEMAEWPWRGRLGPDQGGLKYQAKDLRAEDCPGGRGPEVGDEIRAE